MFSSGNAASYASAGVASVRNSGYQVSDSAGAVNGQAPGYHAVNSGGGFTAAVDGTGLIGYDRHQRLLFNLSLGYGRDDTEYGTSALTPGVSSAGSSRGDHYAVIGGADYSSESFYITGKGLFDLSHTAITNNTDGGTGTTYGHGYTFGAVAGRWFALIGTPTPVRAIANKAPPPTLEGYGLFLNLSASANYSNERNNGFTDTAGFVYGAERVSFTDLGARGNVVAVVPKGGWNWMPYIGMSVDRELGFEHSFDIPAQAGAAADTLFFGQSNTFLGVQGGVNILSHGGATAGVSGFYTASADTKIIGGQAFVKIPFYPDASLASGITAAKK